MKGGGGEGKAVEWIPLETKPWGQLSWFIFFCLCDGRYMTLGLCNGSTWTFWYFAWELITEMQSLTFIARSVSVIIWLWSRCWRVTADNGSSWIWIRKRRSDFDETPIITALIQSACISGRVRKGLQKHNPVTPQRASNPGRIQESIQGQCSPTPAKGSWERGVRNARELVAKTEW